MSSKFFRYASLLIAAVMLASCTGTIDPEQGNGGGDDIENGTGNNGGNEDSGTPVSKELKVKADKMFVQTFGGDYVTLTVTLGDQTLTEGVTFYDGEDNVIPVDEFKFKTEVAGQHEIYAGYGTYFTKQPVTVTAIAVAIPETPEDEHPERTDFRQRVLLTQFTTTGCSWCPSMKLVLKSAIDDKYAEKVVKVDCHSSTMSNRNDPVYVDLKAFEEQCDGLLPSVNLDMIQTTGYLQGMTGADIQVMIDKWYGFKEDKAAGIAVNSSATDDQIVAKVAVKAAETGTYRVGLMLLEDNIVASSSQTQQGSGAADWMNTHNSCIRYMDSKYASGSGVRFYGHSLGEIAAGETAEYVFILDLESIWQNGILKAQQNGCTWAPRWVSEELHLAVFTTTTGTDGKSEFYYVSNVVDCPINGETPFEYAK